MKILITFVLVQKAYDQNQLSQDELLNVHSGLKKNHLTSEKYSRRKAEATDMCKTVQRVYCVTINLCNYRCFF